MTIQQSPHHPSLIEREATKISQDEAGAIAHKDGAYEKLMYDVSSVGAKAQKEVLALVAKIDQREKHQTVIDMKSGYLEIDPIFAKKQFQDKVDHFDFAKETKRAADLIHSDKCHTPPGMLAIGGVLLAAEAKGGRPETLRVIKEINRQLHAMGDHRFLIASADDNGNLQIGILNDNQPLKAPTHGVPIDRT